MREEPKSLAEWLESKGNPKHSIAEGENGSMILVVDDSSSLENGITIFGFREHDFGDHKSFWMSSGWGLRKEYLPALKKFLNDDVHSGPYENMKFNVMWWRDDEEGEHDIVIDVMEAVSEYHACALLRDRTEFGKYPKGAWLEYALNGEKIGLDTRGRIPA